MPKRKTSPKYKKRSLKNKKSKKISQRKVLKPKMHILNKYQRQHLDKELSELKLIYNDMMQELAKYENLVNNCVTEQEFNEHKKTCKKCTKCIKVN